MIKQLIEDLAYDKISISQGLTRAKLIAAKTQNAAFRDWVNRELHGYTGQDELPAYRMIPCQTSFVVNYPFGRRETRQAAVEDAELKPFYYKYDAYESVTQIESELISLAKQIDLTFRLPTDTALILAEPFQEEISQYNGNLKSVLKEFIDA